MHLRAGGRCRYECRSSVDGLAGLYQYRFIELWPAAFEHMYRELSVRIFEPQSQHGRRGLLGGTQRAEQE